MLTVDKALARKAADALIELALSATDRDGIKVNLGSRLQRDDLSTNEALKQALWALTRMEFTMGEREKSPFSLAGASMVE